MLARFDARLQELPLLLVGVLALHRAGYEIAYGDKAHATLEHTGHGYLIFAWPAAASLLVVAAWRFGAHVVRAQRTGLAGGPRTSFRRLWTRAALALAATYVLQEALEAALTHDHHWAVPGVGDAGGLWFATVVAVIAAVIALLLRAGQQVVEWIAYRRQRRARAPRELSHRGPADVVIRLEPMGRHLAERGPPHATAPNRAVDASSAGGASPIFAGVSG